jgi:putative transcriptional regulator
MNGTLVKNELIFDFASGSLGVSKSIFASTYLQLNSKASKLHEKFETLLGDDLFENEDAQITNLKYSDCISDKDNLEPKPTLDVTPITKIFGPIEDLKWKQIYKGFSEFTPDLNDKDELKIIKMDPGASVPIHSHGGREYILVLSGSFCDEYGEYKKGDMQINDQNIKHHPSASDSNGCVCLSITENDVVFFGKFASILNLFTFIKSFFK